VNGKRSRVEDWLAANTLAAVSIAGALMYGITRISYVSFYGEFGLDPEDVGIGYASMLARALPRLLVLATLALLLWAIPLAVIWRRKFTALKEFRGPLAPGAVLAALVTLLVFLPTNAQRSALGVKRGDELRAPSGLFSWDLVNHPFPFTAREVNVEWVDGGQNGQTKLGRPLMLLGSDSDVYYVYDVEFERTLRLPRSLVILSEDG
jgi:hypothetical protein